MRRERARWLSVLPVPLLLALLGTDGFTGGASAGAPSPVGHGAAVTLAAAAPARFFVGDTPRPRT